MNVVAIGDNCIDVYTNRGMSFPGGGAVNFAVQAKRIGAASAYIGTLGTDTNGDWLFSVLQAEGVDVTHVQRAKGSTAVAFVEMHGHERTFIGADRGVREQLVITPEIDTFLNNFDLIHTTLDGRVDAYIEAWHSRGHMTSYDFSHRPTPEQLDLLPHITLAFFSGQKMTFEEAEQAVVNYQQRGALVAVITLGEHGSLAFDGERRFFQPAISVGLTDTLGAGDAFQAGFAVQYFLSRSIERALLAGAERAAEVCQHLGGFGYGRQHE